MLYLEQALNFKRGLHVNALPFMFLYIRVLIVIHYHHRMQRAKPMNEFFAVYSQTSVSR